MMEKWRRNKVANKHQPWAIDMETEMHLTCCCRSALPNQFKHLDTNGEECTKFHGHFEANHRQLNYSFSWWLSSNEWKSFFKEENIWRQRYFSCSTLRPLCRLCFGFLFPFATLTLLCGGAHESLCKHVVRRQLSNSLRFFTHTLFVCCSSLLTPFQDHTLSALKLNPTSSVSTSTLVLYFVWWSLELDSKCYNHHVNSSELIIPKIVLQFIH